MSGAMPPRRDGRSGGAGVTVQPALHDLLLEPRGGALLKGLGIKVWIVDTLTMEPTFLSEPLTELLGSAVQLKRPLDAAVHPEDRASLVVACRAVAASRAARTVSYRTFKEGRVVALTVELHPLPDVNGGGREVAGVVVSAMAMVMPPVATDLASLINTVDGIVWEADEEFRFTFVSEQAERLLGYPRSRWIEEPRFWVDHLHPEDRERCMRFCVEQTARGQPHQFEYRMIAADGRVVWLRDIVSVLNPRGGPRLLRGVMVDVTGQHEMQEAVERSVSLLRAALEATADGILVVSQRGRVAAWNRRFAMMWRLPEECLESAKDASLVSRVLEQLREPEAFQARIRWFYEHPEEEGEDVIHFKDGRVVERYSRPQRVAGQVVGRVWSFRDVTKRKRAEEALARSEEKYRELYNKTPVMMHSVDRHGRLLSVSDFWLASLGFTRQEVLGRKSVEFLTPESRKYATEVVLPEFFTTGVCRDVPYQFVRRDGSVMDVLLSAIAERNAEGEVVRSLAVLVDVTARHRAEQQRERALALLDTLLMSAPVPMGFLDRDLRFQRVNAGLAALHGVRPEDDVGRTIWEASPGMAPQVAPIMRRVLETGQATTNVELSGEVPSAPGEIRSFLASYYPVSTVAGEMTGVGVVVVDVTERTRAAELQARLYREAQQAIRARDEFMSIASHELKTPLTPLVLLLQLMERRVRRGEPVDPADISKAQSQLGRLCGLIKDLLDVSRIQAGRLALRREPVNLCELVREVISAHPAGEENRMRLDVPTTGVHVDGDRDRLLQVVNNLVDNAVKYSPRDKPIDVRVSRNGGEALLSVTDRGIGIPREQQPMLFERFFRASNAPTTSYGGLGLGLYICRDIVERHGGRIWVDSETGRGATFYVALPLCAAP
ncbi:MAG: PAS domain S-box protein [Myxococcota bacterium]